MNNYIKFPSLFKKNLATEYADLPKSLSVNEIDFTNVRGSVRLIHKNVLTPNSVAILRENILNFNFGK